MNQLIPVFCLGPKASYGHEARKIALPMVQRMMPGALFGEEFAPDNVSVLECAIEVNGVAVIPIENGQEGFVTQVMGWRMRQSSYPLTVVGEIRLPIYHRLLVRHGIKKENITHVVSHQQALGQCRNNLRMLGGIKTIEASSTAAAAEAVASGVFPETYAAIASEVAGKTYGLESLGEIADVPNNKTLFHVCAPWKVPLLQQEKTAMLFDLPDKTNTLRTVLNIMADVNHTSITSVPTGTLEKYSFYLVSEVAFNSTNFQWRYTELKKHTSNLRILGSFPKADTHPHSVSKLQEKRIGIIGMGQLGKAHDHFLRMRGMEPLVYDTKLQNGMSIPLLVAQSDIVFVAVPATEVANVLRDIAPYTRKEQWVISLSSVMKEASCGAAAFAQLHFNAAPRGMSFGRRKAFVAIDHQSVSVEAQWGIAWIQVFVLEFEAVYQSITVDEHMNLCRVEKVAGILLLTLMGEAIDEFFPGDLERLIEYSSPVSEIMFALMGKVLSQGEMYAGIARENEGTDDMLELMLEKIGKCLANMRFNPEAFTAALRSLRERLGIEAIEGLARRAERVLSSPSLFRTI